MADGEMAWELGENVVGEDFRNQAHALDVGEMLAVAVVMPRIPGRALKMQSARWLRERRQDGCRWLRRRIAELVAGGAKLQD